jgi:hypothetical protein
VYDAAAGVPLFVKRCCALTVQRRRRIEKLFCFEAQVTELRRGGPML